MIKAWRIAKAKHQHQAFTGQGCQFASGRWHYQNVAIVYCSDTQALSALEVFVQLQEDGKHIKFVLFELYIPERAVLTIESITTLPARWRQQPPGSGTKKIGSDWVRSGASAVLSVPSAITPSDRNFLLNPSHPDCRTIEVGEPTPFNFDARLWN